MMDRPGDDRQQRRRKKEEMRQEQEIGKSEPKTSIINLIMSSCFYVMKYRYSEMDILLPSSLVFVFCLVQTRQVRSRNCAQLLMNRGISR